MKQKTPRKKFDFYETPKAMVHDLCYYHSSFFDLLENSIIFEPCVGNKAILNPLKEYYGKNTQYITNDIQDGLGDYNLDATDPQVWVSGFNSLGVDLIITNPPFNVAYEILVNAYECANVGVIMLLRLSFLEPTLKRGAWLQKHPPTFVRVYGSPRPKFTEPNKDTVTTAWMGWVKKHQTKLASQLSFATHWNN